MKANEAPERVYLHLTTGDCILNGKYYEYKPAKIRYDDKIIEYVRKDAFIEKACEWINEHTSLSEKLVIENFRKYIEGE